MFTRSLKDLSRSDIAIAGGKGASLGEMLGAGIAVPAGFVVLARAWDYFLQETRLSREIDAILRQAGTEDINRLMKASEAIQAMIFEKKMPANIAGEIQDQFRKLKTKYVAVRSSATGEDSSSAAWAGQL